MNRKQKLSNLYKVSSKLGRSAASGLSFNHAEKALLDRSPEAQPSKDQIFSEIKSNPIFDAGQVEQISDIVLDDRFRPITSRSEKAFLELGSFLAEKVDKLTEILDFLTGNRYQAGWISENFNITPNSISSVKDEFLKLNEAQEGWHLAKAREQGQEVAAQGRYGNGYETNDVRHEFEDGWKIVYVPAIGEGPAYKGDSSKSNDRTIEGNILGLCLGSSMGMYQNNSEGAIYSVRDPGNNPKVTIRIYDNSLQEAKGKSNLSPSVDGASKAAEWFALQSNLRYKDCPDFESFPPLTKEEAEKEFSENPEGAWLVGWIAHWYNSGVDIIDSSVQSALQRHDISVLKSGLTKKYKELAQPTVRHWAERWTEADDPSIWGRFEVWDGINKQELWKTYKKEPWMKNAVEKLFDRNYDKMNWENVDHPDMEPENKHNRTIAFKLGIHKLEEFKEYAKSVAKDLVARRPEAFFEANMPLDYPDYATAATKKISKDDPSVFFKNFGAWNGINKRIRDYLLDDYEEYEKVAVKSLVSDDPKGFFALKLDKVFSKLTDIAVENLVQISPTHYFSESYKTKEMRPDLENEAVIGVAESDGKFFFENRFHLGYPELIQIAIDTLIDKTPAYFFRLDCARTGAEPSRIIRHYNRSTACINLPNVLQDYEGSRRKAAENITTEGGSFVTFFKRYKLHHDYPDIGRGIAKTLVDGEVFNISNEPRNVGIFFTLGLSDFYPDLGEVAAKMLLESDALEFYRRDIDKIYPELVKGIEGSPSPEDTPAVGGDEDAEEAEEDIKSLSSLRAWLFGLEFTKEAKKIGEITGQFRPHKRGED